jgi:hypothetical protein
MLVRCCMIDTENFRRRVFHQVNGWKIERIRDFGGADQRQIHALQHTEIP